MGRAPAKCVAVTVLALAVAIGLPVGTSLGASRTLGLRAVHFSGSFVPQQITATAGSLWILGSTSPSTFTACTIERFDPSTLEALSYALPQCATGITSGNGRVYLLVNQVQPNTNTRDYRIEVFDPTTLSAQVLPPVVLQNIGSAVAHTDLSFGDGSLWLYGYALGGKNEVVQIALDSGDVENTIGNAPEIGGVYPAVVGNSAGEWLGGGPGAPAGLEWVHAGTGTATNITLVTGGRSGSILWLSGTTVVTTRLVALDEQGHVAVRSPWENVGLYPVVATPDGHLWDVEYPARCGGFETLLEIDPSTGVSRAAARLASSPAACNDEEAGSELAAIGRAVFVFFPTAGAGSVLYRATT